MMARNTNKAPAPQPQPQIAKPTPLAPQPHAGNETTPSLTLIETVGANLTPGKGTKSPREQAKAQLTEKITAKVNVMGVVRQQLAEAKDLFDLGSGKNTEAKEVANKAAISLYQARCDGVLTADEVSSALVDQFGAKPKKDGSAGKTPEGEGEAIRKRVVRAAFARMHLETGDGGQFFEGLEADSENKDGLSLSDVVYGLDAGEYSIWTAYEKFAEIKRDNAEKVELAFDAKRIGGIVENLGKPGAVQQYKNNPALIAAYAALVDILDIVDAAAAK